MHQDVRSSGFGAVRSIMDWQQLGKERKGILKTKVSHQMVSKEPIVLFTRALLPGGEAKKKKKVSRQAFPPCNDKELLPAAFRLHGFTDVLKKPQPTVSLYLN